MLGTIVNCIAIIVGSIVGLLVQGRLPSKISETIMAGLGLCVLYIGISGSLKGQDPMVLIICIAVGALIGEVIDIDKRLNNLGEFLEKKFKRKGGEKISIAEGFVTSSLLFCVGAMAIVGSLESGLQHKYDTLFAKSALDGISAIIFTSSLGIGVIFAAVAVFVYQGAITLGAAFLSNYLNATVIANMTSVGSLLIIALGLNILGMKKIKIANLLPAVFLPIILGLFY